MYGFGYLLPILEAAIGAAVLVGFRNPSCADLRGDPYDRPHVRISPTLAPSFINDHLCGGLH